ncbi:hypothetical protein ABB37_07757 [Leptomonas pyrrhocoris]|uniref:Uncharacterized protein n=1 Tax=Leptomonas pyrrhocoris TaxID=157538 RepID=A0A0N0VDS6_LEPPY|nr:hypothetical protein ABB37_07757 [Leptomonas pyrrhocoris]KPA76432.1 hypothetical protein ABB37_07757 [Leptomonas pyrrhocoris]|eukprot:XP_015654871.1 hypothetical protein ABB37_07757 [Leptomonas pyrrhocoris]
MGNASSDHRSDIAHGDAGSDATARNPLQRPSNASSQAHAAATRAQVGYSHTTSNGGGGGSRSNRHRNSTHGRTSDDRDDERSNLPLSFSIPQPPPPSSALQSVQTGNAGEGSRPRRVSVTVSSEANPVQPTPQRLTGFPRVGTNGSFGSNNGSFVSHVSSLNGKPRLTLGEARELLLSIFFPRQGQLECIASGFLTVEHYALMRGFWAPFLTTELRDKWYLDAVMLSVLGKDRWRSSRQQKEIIMSVSPSREQVLQLNQQRQEYSDQLRERLLDLCGSLVESNEYHNKKRTLQTLLEEYHRHKEAHSNGAPGGDSDSFGGSGADHKRDLSRTTSGATSEVQHQELLSLSLMRLQTTVSTSFDCFDLLARRIPTSVVASLPSSYLLSSTPVVYEPIAFQEKKVGDLDTMSFFMSLESRRRLLNGEAPDDSERLMNTSFNELGFTQSFSMRNNGNAESRIDSARQLYSAVRHAGLVVTTACSSMVLTVMFQLAEVLRVRQAFRDNRAKAAQKGITLEQLIGRKEATIHTYAGKHTDNLEELKRYAITDEMSLAVLTKLLIKRFKKENQAKMEKLRKRYPNVFAYLEAIAPPEEHDDFDVTRLLSGMVLKMMFLTGGGQRSIVADDRRVPGGISQVTDDVAISNMLEVPLLNRICWVACMMGMPIMSNHGILAQKHQGKPLTYVELDECCGVMRQLFQAVGALPCGSACPQQFKEWFPLFPFYAVNAEGKRVLMYLYAAQVSPIQRVPLTVQKDMTLLSFATALQAAKGKGRVDIANYFFEPALTVGYTEKDSDSELNSMSASVVPPPPPAKAAGPTSLLAPTSLADTINASDSVRSDRASPLSTSVNGSSAPRVMPASLSPVAVGQSNASPPAKDRYQYMTAVNPGSPTSATSPKTSPPKSITRQANSISNNNNISNAPGQLKSSLLDDQLSNSSSSASPSCSTLLEGDRDIDVYTCVNPQTQLYMRCSNEATLRRHRATELTPSVSVSYLHSQHEVQARRPDIALALHQTVPKLMPSEGFLVVRWTSAEPLVTFCAGDIVSAMAERVSASAASPGNSGDMYKRNSSSAGALNPPGAARYFTGATRPSQDGGITAGADGGSAANRSLHPITTTSGARSPDGGTGRLLIPPSPRSHTMRVNDSMPQDSAARPAGTGLSGRIGGATPSDHAGAHSSNYDAGYEGTDEDAANSSVNSGIAMEKTRMYQGLMHEFLGVKEKASRRLAVRWNVIDVLPSMQLVHRTRRMSASVKSGAASVNGSSKQQQEQLQYRNEVVLHVAAPEIPMSLPLRILTIGHERASMSVFTFISPDSDAACWANPRLIEAIVNRGDKGGGSSGGFNRTNSSGNYLSGSALSKGPSGILCNTEEELHNVFFSIGVLLSNAIVNGVYFSAPIAPLAFLLMKKALNSGDYSFKSFMWLEPADGNLLNPALVLNSAYEILTMTEQQYVAFLQSRGVAYGDAHVFPVMHSLLDEMKEDRLWQPMGTQQQQQQPAAATAERSRLAQSQMSIGRQPRVHDSGDSTSLPTSSNPREKSFNTSHMSSGMNEYMKLIELHNRRGSTFRRSQLSSGTAGNGGRGASVSGMLPNILMSVNVPVHDRLQGYRSQQQLQHKGDGQRAASDTLSLEQLYAQLPSRREYLFLYLVNDLAWGSARRDDVGEKNKELWVSMARGFMTSAVAKSPLMTNCCSRIIREVLCVPRSDG